MTDSEISVADRFAIQDLLGRLYWALDTGDVKGITSLFTDDGVMITGSGDRFAGRAELQRFAEHAVGPNAPGRQHIGRPLYIFRNGDGWTVRSYLTILHCDQETGEKRIRGMSASDDTVVKTAAGWRFKERKNTNWTGKSLPWVGG